ncbi:hypothetical protein [Deinococcus peraridilitoris]|uniref:Uncharacterized protein n=1 Tax=Deinococcus peraridilitoris (strain DSM 19664 / LMG 22246 / CIP 109416 / KR-200) TaxID=937777 RepID=L0A0T9_DEIPD|nr:hypothetical protein [Deinococcus peraridilitoris]AFZ67074.1 hypothetical protein Deipe_1533 [Deinococcus peraridilitoris DSM 19664]
MAFKPNPHLERELDRALDKVGEGIAEEFVSFLLDRLSGPGSGTHWPGLPNPSSSPGDYPAEQSGALLASIGKSQRSLNGMWAVGALNEIAPVPVEAWALEYPSPPGSPVKRDSEHGSRGWLSKALADDELHARLHRKIKEVVASL